MGNLKSNYPYVQQEILNESMYEHPRKLWMILEHCPHPLIMERWAVVWPEHDPLEGCYLESSVHVPGRGTWRDMIVPLDAVVAVRFMQRGQM
jgi:hypothetical protein